MKNSIFQVFVFAALALLWTACSNDKPQVSTVAAPAPVEAPVAPAPAVDSLAAIEKAEAEVIQNTGELKKALDALK